MPVRAPKPRQRRAALASDPSTADAETAPAPEEPSYGHPIFGNAPVRTIAVHKVRYPGGNIKNREVLLACGTVSPGELLDPSQLFGLFDAGRYQLNPIGSTGHLVGTPRRFDVPNPETGSLDLVLPTSDPEVPPTPPVVVAPPAPAGSSSLALEMVGMWKDIAKGAEESRKNDFNAFIALMQASTGKATDAGLTAFVQAELVIARARISDLEGRAERQSLEMSELRLRLARRPSGGDEELTAAVVAGAAERFGILPPGTADRMSRGAASRAEPSGPAAPPAPESNVGLPSGEEFAAMVKAGAAAGGIPPEMIRRLVKLRRVNAVAEDLWAVAEPIAEQMGLL